MGGTQGGLPLFLREGERVVEEEFVGIGLGGGEQGRWGWQLGCKVNTFKKIKENEIV